MFHPMMMSRDPTRMARRSGNMITEIQKMIRMAQ